MTTEMCACRIRGPLALDALVGDGATREINGCIYEVVYCPTHAAAARMAAILSELAGWPLGHAALFDDSIEQARAVVRELEGR